MDESHSPPAMVEPAMADFYLHESGATTLAPGSASSAQPTMEHARADVDAHAGALQKCWNTLSNGACSQSSTVASPSDASRCFRRCRRGLKIGHGSYGCVFKAQDPDTGQILAVKEALIDDAGYVDKMQKELGICKDLRHPNIVTCLGHDYHEQRLSIYLEYIPGGSLESVLAEFGPYEGALLRSSTRCLLEGLNYLHTHSPPVVHRDIKSANVLVGLNACLKLADFGCSKRDDLTTSFRTVGSIPWMAPEVIMGKTAEGEGGHGRKADVWSLGCVVIEMASGQRPWGEAFDNPMAGMRRIAMTEEVPPVPGELPDTGREMVRSCFARSPQERPWAGELLTHAFLDESLY